MSMSGLMSHDVVALMTAVKARSRRLLVSWTNQAGTNSSNDKTYLVLDAPPSTHEQLYLSNDDSVDRKSYEYENVYAIHQTPTLIHESQYQALRLIRQIALVRLNCHRGLDDKVFESSDVVDSGGVSMPVGMSDT